ncbi:MAG: hypothetical protein DDT31_00197 [Syntrophomonadaceae bacterium]|nr:hypothetical protein [Bacillota bacterium]
MKIVAISNPTLAFDSFTLARAFGYITFIYHYANPTRTLSPHKFAYVHTDEELKEKIELLMADVSAREEILRW